MVWANGQAGPCMGQCMVWYMSILPGLARFGAGDGGGEEGFGVLSGCEMEIFSINPDPNRTPPNRHPVEQHDTAAAIMMKI